MSCGLRNVHLYSLCLILADILPPAHGAQLTSVLKKVFLKVFDHDAHVKCLCIHF